MSNVAENETEQVAASKVKAVTDNRKESEALTAREGSLSRQRHDGVALEFNFGA